MHTLDTPVIAPHLIGRAQEMETLTRALQRAQQSEGQCLLLVGEAGVGKTRLLAEIRRWAKDEGHS